MPNKWTYEQRREALGDLHAINPDAGMESFNSGVSYNSEMVDIACERNELKDALIGCIANCGTCDPSGTYGPICDSCNNGRCALAHTGMTPDQIAEAIYKAGPEALREAIDAE